MGLNPPSHSLAKASSHKSGGRGSSKRDLEKTEDYLAGAGSPGLRSAFECPTDSTAQAYFSVPDHRCGHFFGVIPKLLFLALFECRLCWSWLLSMSYSRR